MMLCYDDIMMTLTLSRFVAIAVASLVNPIFNTFEKYARITPDIKKWIKSIATGARDSTCN